jgi:hypothetical protein
VVNKSILSAALVAGMAIAPFVLAQVQPVTPRARGCGKAMDKNTYWILELDLDYA